MLSLTWQTILNINLDLANNHCRRSRTNQINKYSLDRDDIEERLIVMGKDI